MTHKNTTPANREGLAQCTLFTPPCRPSTRFALPCAGLGIRPLFSYPEVLKARADHTTGAWHVYTTPVKSDDRPMGLYLAVAGSTPQGFAAIYRAMCEGAI